MEDENGLELSLGLGYGGPSSKSKSKSGNDQKLDSSSASIVTDSRKAHEVDGAMNFNIFGSEGSNKRKIPFDDVSSQNKHEKEAKKSHISIPDDSSSAENEDVAESEVNGSTSKGPSKPGNWNYEVQFPVQPANIVNAALPFHVKDSSSVGASSMKQVMPASNGDRRMDSHSVNPGSSSVMFSYSPVQLPKLDKDNAWGLVSHLQQFPPLVASKGSSNTAMQVIGQNISESRHAKQHLAEEGSTTQSEDNAKGSTTDLRAKDTPEQSTTEVFPFDLSAIRPGIGGELKFGGSGSYPDLPWVSTTAPGPKGRTISGVTYRFSASQIRIVCACHGSHMSPEDFVRHAAEANLEAGNGVSTLPNSNPAASAQS